jgi:heptaprenylglyceryl phosphate synthase
MGITDEIVVQFKDDVSQQRIDEMHKKYNVVVKKNTDLFQLLSVSKDNDVLEIANAYQTSGLVNFSHPNFIAKIESFYQPPDPYFSNQFYLRNTGQSVNSRSCTAGADSIL